MNEREHLLTCLSEECMEVGKAVSKALRFGLQHAPEGKTVSNAELIAAELNDVVAVAELLEELGIIPARHTLADVDRKKSKVLEHLRYARSIGTVKP